MRRPPRTSLTAILLAILALAAIGCGGSEVSADEVPGPPVALTVPSDRDLGGGSADEGADASSDENADGETGGTAEDGATVEPDATALPEATVAPETPAAPEDSATNDSPPPAGSEAEQFEDFCAQNAGAC